MLEKSYLYATTFTAFFFLTCPFKEAEGKREGLQQPWADVGAQPGGAAPPANNWGETGMSELCIPHLPSLLGRLRLPPKVSVSAG